MSNTQYNDTFNIRNSPSRLPERTLPSASNPASPRSNARKLLEQPQPLASSAGIVVQPTLLRQAGRLESFGRTLRGYISPAITQLSSSSQDRGTPDRPKPPRPVSLGRYGASDLSALRFGQVDSSSLSKDALWTRWQTVSSRSLLLIGYTHGIRIWDATILDSVTEILTLATSAQVTHASLLTNRNPHPKKEFTLVLIIGNDLDSKICSYSVSNHTWLAHHDIPYLQVLETSADFVVASSTRPHALHVFDSSLTVLLHTIKSVSVHSPAPIFALSSRLLAFAEEPRNINTNRYSYAGNSQGSSSKILESTLKGALEIGSGLFQTAKALGGMAIDSYSKSAPSGSSPLGQLSSAQQEAVKPNQHTPGQGLHIRVVDLEALINESQSSTLHTIAHWRWTNSPSSTRSLRMLKWNSSGTLLSAGGVDGSLIRVFAVRPKPTVQRRNDAETSGDGVWHLYDLQRGVTSADIEDFEWNNDCRWAGLISSNGTLHLFATNPYGGAPDIPSHLNHSVKNVQELQPLGTLLRPLARARPLANLANPEQGLARPLSFTFLPSSSSLSSTALPHPLNYPPSAAPTPPTASPRMTVNALSPTRVNASQSNQTFQDALVFDPVDHLLYLCRFSIKLAITEQTPARDNASLASTPSGSVSGSVPGGSLSRIMSGVSGRFMSSNTSLDESSTKRSVGSSLVGEELTLAIWSLKGPNEWQEVKTSFPPAALNKPVITSPAAPAEWLSYAELSTYSKSTTVVPGSIYLSHQFAFGALLDDYQALLRRSDLNVTASKIEVRKEVVIRSGDQAHDHPDSEAPSEGFLGFYNGEATISPPGVYRHGSNPSTSLLGTTPPSVGSYGQKGASRSSFDEPLASALETSLDYSAATSPSVLPALPNGLPAKHRKGNDPRIIADAIIPPIRRVGEGMGDGIGRLRKEFRDRVRSPRVRPTTGVETLLEFDEPDEMFIVDGLEQPTQPLIHHAIGGSNLHRQLSEGAEVVLLASPSSDLLQLDPISTSGVLTSSGGPSSGAATVLAVSPVTVLSQETDDMQWVRNGEVYQEAVEEDARFDDVSRVLDEEAAERKQAIATLQASELESTTSKKRSRTRKGRKR